MEAISAFLMVMAVILVYTPTYLQTHFNHTIQLVSKIIGYLFFICSIWFLEIDSSLYTKLLIITCILPFPFIQIKQVFNNKSKPII